MKNKRMKNKQLEKKTEPEANWATLKPYISAEYGFK